MNSKIIRSKKTTSQQNSAEFQGDRAVVWNYNLKKLGSDGEGCLTAPCFRPEPMLEDWVEVMYWASQSSFDVVKGLESILEGIKQNARTNIKPKDKTPF